MTFRFKVDDHLVKGEKKGVEIHREGEFVASLYGEGDKLKIISKHVDSVALDKVYPPTVIIRLKCE